MVKCSIGTIASALKKDGDPVAVLVDAGLFERMTRMQNYFDVLCQRIAYGFADLPEQQGMAEIDAAIALVRGQ